MATQMTVIPMPEAAQRLGIAQDVLTRLIKSDKIRVRSVRTGDGQTMLDEKDIERMAKAKALRDQIWKRVAKFEDETIGVSDAMELYGLQDKTIYLCIEKGYIRAGAGGKGGRGKKRLLNRADVAYVAELARRGGGRGHRLFGPDVIPPHAI